MSHEHSYSIHGIITVNSEVQLPELAWFRTPELAKRPTIDVSIGKVDQDRRPPEASATSGDCRIQYSEGLGPLGFAVEIEVGSTIRVLASQLLGRSPHVLYTNVVEPILRWAFVARGHALVHGACLAFGGNGILITAKTDTGKTTTLLKLLMSHKEAKFISDDLTLVAPDGSVLTFPKPLTVSQHTVSSINTNTLSRCERMALILQSRVHSRAGRRLALLLAGTNLPMATVNTLVQLIIPPPKYHIQRLMPGVEIARKATAAGLFAIERGGTGEVELDPEEAVGILLRNCEDSYGFPPYHAIESFLRRSNGQDLRDTECEIVSKAFGECPSMLLRSRHLDWWQRIPTLAHHHLAAV